MSILIVEDDRDTRECLAELLADEGYRTLTAASGEEALRIVGLQRATVQLVLLDLLLPGMDGWQVAELMAESRIPVIIMTGLPRGSLPPGAVAALPKPFGLEELLAAVRSHLRTARTLERRSVLSLGTEPIGMQNVSECCGQA